ncbi:proteasome assembly chaperone 2 [Galleria mellonella]|uniref:Proteasome assembly chaperone 2 n=1 Tax=Galleria mellonella TaxID=7137 RepID=A0A6J1WYJ2_GALME|nr:proteasome assembly chaperone 2 [Galleria mellonella]
MGHDIWNFIDNSDLNEYTLIVPSVAVGNVGQLSCDLLISSLQMKKIASVYSPALIPVLGYDPYNLQSNSLSSSCEIYKSDRKNIVVLQLRAPLICKSARIFLEEIIKRFKEKNIKDIIILTSSFAHENKHISTSPFRFVASESSLYKKKILDLHWIEHKCVDSPLKIYGGGFSSLLYEICQENSMPCLILYKYCSEGDNIPDAYDMISHLSSVVPLFSDKFDLLSQMIQPVSWKLLFGRPPPRDIY